MNKKETIDYIERLLLDDALTEEVRLGLEEALKKLKQNYTRQNVIEVIKIVAELLGIGKDLF